jgi:hypothetical protein
MYFLYDSSIPRYMYMYNAFEASSDKRNRARPASGSAINDHFYPHLSLNTTPAVFYAPYMTWPMGLSSVMPEAIRLLSGFPVALATEHRAIVGELLEITSVK